MELQPNWRVTPSLLNKYDDYVHSERIWDDLYGKNEDPKVSLAEFDAKQEQELLDEINRVKKAPIESASRGTALNEIVDCILEHRAPKDGVGLRSVYGPDGSPQHISAEIDGFTFLFDYSLCMGLASYFRGSVCQHYCEAVMDTSFGPVILYGYSDYVLRDVVYDLKSTANYKYGKFDDGWQKDLYPWCLVESGELQSVSGFEYTVVQLSGGGVTNPIIGGTVYREWHDYDHKLSGERLRGAVEGLLSFVEQHKNKITNKRIFNK